jgi:hypothetical protein
MSRVFAVTIDDGDDVQWISAAVRQCAAVVCSGKLQTHACREIMGMLDRIEETMHGNWEILRHIVPAFEHLLKRIRAFGYSVQEFQRKSVQEPIFAVIYRLICWFEMCGGGLHQVIPDIVLRCMVEILLIFVDVDASVQDLISPVFEKIMNYAYWEKTAYGSVSALILEVLQEAKKKALATNFNDRIWVILCTISEERISSGQSKADAIWNIVVYLLEGENSDNLNEQ